MLVSDGYGVLSVIEREREREREREGMHVVIVTESGE